MDGRVRNGSAFFHHFKVIVNFWNDHFRTGEKVGAICDLYRFGFITGVKSCRKGNIKALDLYDDFISDYQKRKRYFSLTLISSPFYTRYDQKEIIVKLPNAFPDEPTENYIHPESKS